MIPQRPTRVGELIKREISNIIQQELQDPKLGFITVTKVNMSKDLKQANVWISVMGNNKDKENSVGILTRAQNRIKQILSSRVKLRYMPMLQFHLDTSIEYDVHIGEIISRLRKEEGWE